MEMADNFLSATKTLRQWTKNQSPIKRHLSNGTQDTASSKFALVYWFDISGSIPPNADEDMIEIEIDKQVFPAHGLCHSDNKIRVTFAPHATQQVSGPIPKAILHIPRVDMLASLEEALETKRDWRLAEKVLAGQGTPGHKTLFPTVQNRRKHVDPHTLAAWEQVLGSQVSYLWGPPGTGKTFGVATILASLLESGESVLAVSNTHVAVEQMLWALVQTPSAKASEKGATQEKAQETSEKKPAEEGGLLYQDPRLSAGSILKVGIRHQQKLPDTVFLDWHLAQRKQEVQQAMAALEEQEQQHRASCQAAAAALAAWQTKEDAERSRQYAGTGLEKTSLLYNNAGQEYARTQEVRGKAQAELQQAERSFFLIRGWRIKQALTRFSLAQQAENAAYYTYTEQAGLVRDWQAHVSATTHALAQIEEKDAASFEHSSTTWQEQHESAKRALAEVEARKEELERTRNDNKKSLINQAQAVFATLFSSCTSPALQRSFDTVIIDEASMGPLPQIALAAAKAKKQVIIVGDFYQLPPILTIPKRKNSSDNSRTRELTKKVEDVFKKDIFTAAGIMQAVESGEKHALLAKLDTQRRMHPDIANMARTFVYKKHLKDHISVKKRKCPAWATSVLGNAPLVTVNIDWMHPHCQPDGGSCINLISASVCLQLAALYAQRLPEPKDNDPPSIGIITPYRPQANRIASFVEGTGLSSRVAVGTVHTFQGNECDLIIFDTVAAPTATGRLRLAQSDNGIWAEARKDLNVTVTRARHRFITIADATWMEKYAAEESCYGHLWRTLEKNGTRHDSPLPLIEQYGIDLGAGTRCGWTTSPSHTHSFLNEREYYKRFSNDLEEAKNTVDICMAFLGKERWGPLGLKKKLHDILRKRPPIALTIYHRPFPSTEKERAQHKGRNLEWEKREFTELAEAGAKLVPIKGLHAKTIVFDKKITYIGSHNLASQIDSQEQTQRIDNAENASNALESLRPVEQTRSQYRRT